MAIGCRGVPLRRLIAGTVIVAAFALASAGNAPAVSGKQITVATGVGSQPPAVAVDSSGTAYVAWNNNTDLGSSNNFVQFCVLPAGASACSHAGSLTPADGA